MAKNLYYCRVKVSRGPGSAIPEDVQGAFVPAFAVAEDHQKALGLIIPGLLRQGWVFEELVQNRVDEMEARHWAEFIDATWPALKDEMPAQAVVDGMLETGGVFYGPISAWLNPGSEVDQPG